jgi:hypothetical protein
MPMPAISTMPTKQQTTALAQTAALATFSAVFGCLYAAAVCALLGILAGALCFAGQLCDHSREMRVVERSLY